MAIQFDGQVVPSFVKIQDIEVGLLPRIEQATIEIRGRPGSFDFGNQVNERKIVITYSIVAESPADLRQKARIMANWVYSEEPKKLVLLDEPDYFYWAKVTGTPELNEVYKVGSGTLEFRCTDPHAYGVLHTRQISGGVERVEEDIDTQAEWNSGALVGVTATTNGLVLSKEGADYTFNETNWATGSHTQTQNVNDHLVLASTNQTTNATHIDDFTAGTFTDTVKSGTELTMINLPSWNYTDHLNNYLGTGWIEFIDTTDPGTGTITQETGHVRLFSDNKDVALRYNPTGIFPKTFDFVYKLSQANPANTKTTRCLARFVEDRAGSFYVYATYLTDTGGAWKWGRMVLRNTTSADLYINGVFDRTITAASTTLNQRVQFFMDQSLDQGDFRLSYFAYSNSVLHPTQVSSYEFPYAGDHVSSEYDLSLLGNYQNGVINYTSTTPAGVEGFDSSATVEVNIFKNGTWRGYQQVTNGGTLPYLSSGESLSGVKARIRESLKTYDVANPAKISAVQMVVNGIKTVYASSGSRVSIADSGIQSVGKAKTATIHWTENKPSGTDLKAYVALEQGGVLGSFQEVTNGSTIPQISSTVDLSNSKLTTRFDLTTSNTAVTPEVITCTYALQSAYKMTGYWISNGTSLDISEVEGSLITWDGTPNDSPDIQVFTQLVETGQQPMSEAWKATSNGAMIPDIQVGANLSGKRLYTKTELSSNGMQTPTIHRLLWQVEQAGGNVVNYQGMTRAFPLMTITFTMNVNTFELLHQETGNRLYFPRSFVAGDVLAIDHAKGKVILNGQSILSSLSLDSDFLFLQPGSNTLVVSPANSCTVVAEWRDRYL